MAVGQQRYHHIRMVGRVAALLAVAVEDGRELVDIAFLAQADSKLWAQSVSPAAIASLMMMALEATSPGVVKRLP